MRPMKKVAPVVFVFLMVHVALTQEQPEDYKSFAVGPLKLEINARPGQTIRKNIRVVTANTEETTNYRVELSELGQQLNGAKQSVPTGEGTRSCVEWIEAPRNVSVPPNGSADIPLTIRIPGGTRGNYFAAVMVRLITEPKDSPIVMMVQPAIMSEVMVNIAGPAPLQMDVKEFTMRPRKDNAPPEIVFKALNTGVWKTSLEGDILLYGPRGTFPIRTSIPYTRGQKPFTVYPRQGILLHCPLETTPPPGTYRAVVRLVLNDAVQTRSEFSLEIPRDHRSGGLGGRLVKRTEYDVSLLVEPDLVEITMPPGASRTIPIRIRNQDERKAKVRLNVSDIRLERNGFWTYPEQVSDQPSMIEIEQDSFTLDPHRMRTVRARVVVPKDRTDTKPLIQSVRVLASAEGKTSGWDSEAEYGTVVIATDPKADPPSLEIQSLKLYAKSSENNPTAAVLPDKHGGGRIARVSGSLSLERSSGELITDLEIGSSNGEIVFPDGIREFRLRIPPLDDGDFQVKAELKVEGQRGSELKARESFTSKASIPKGLREK